jgi:hypothetical protein
MRRLLAFASTNVSSPAADAGYAGTVRPGRRCRAMTQASDVLPHATADDNEDAVVGGAWLGPAIGAAVLTVAWAIYLVPVFMGIVLAA